MQEQYFDASGWSALQDEYSLTPQADWYTDSSSTSIMAPLTEANLSAHRATLAVPSFQGIMARCPPPLQQQPVFCWEIDFEPLTIVSSVLGKRAREDEDSKYLEYLQSGYKRLCDLERQPLLLQQPVDQVQDLSQFFPIGWQDPIEASQAYWDDWQPEPEYLPKLYTSVVDEAEYTLEMAMRQIQQNFLESQMELDLMHGTQAVNPFVGPYQQYLDELLPLGSAFEEPVELALSPVQQQQPLFPIFNDHLDYPALTYTVPNVPFPSVTTGWTKPLSERKTPPWRCHTPFADTEEGERVLSGLPTPRVYLQDPVSCKLLSRKTPIVIRRGRFVPPLHLVWNAKAQHYPMMMPGFFAVRGWF